MQWIEASIETKSEEIDEITSWLIGKGIQGVSIEDEQDLQRFLEQNRQYWDYIDESLTQQYKGISRVKFYLIDDAEGWKRLRELETGSGREIKTKLLADQNWEYTWREHFQPIEIGKRLMIVPEWLDPELNGRVALRLDPGLAFGTGNHATTRMCLEVMDRLDLEGKRALDLGFGSGILGIGALLLGCKEVMGCDVDPNATTAARENAALNHISEEQLRVCVGNVITDKGVRTYLGSGYDLVLANIVADVILPLTGIVRRFMAPGAMFVCSGIIDNRAGEVEAELKKQGFDIIEHLNEEEWHCFACI